MYSHMELKRHIGEGGSLSSSLSSSDVTKVQGESIDEIENGTNWYLHIGSVVFCCNNIFPAFDHIQADIFSLSSYGLPQKS